MEVVARDNVAAGRSRGHFLHNALFVVECGTQYGDVLYVFQCQHKDFENVGSIIREAYAHGMEIFTESVNTKSLQLIISVDSFCSRLSPLMMRESKSEQSARMRTADKGSLHV